MKRDRLVSTIAAVLLLEVGCALAFCQLAFLPITSGGAQVRFHSFLLLAPFCAAAPYLGLHAYLGLAAGIGALLCARIQLMPLDYYELLFSNPVGAVLAVCVLALVCRLARKAATRLGKDNVFVLAAVLLAASFAVSCAWLAYLHAIFGAYGYAEYVDELAGAWWSAAFWGQVVFDWVFWLATSLLVRALERRIARDEVPRTATVFRRWLLLVVTGAFLLTTSVSFAFSTAQALSEADASLTAQASSVLAQVEERTREGRDATGVADAYAGGFGDAIVVTKGGSLVSTSNEAYAQTLAAEGEDAAIGLDGLAFLQDPLTLGITYLRQATSGTHTVFALATSERVFAARTSTIALNTLCYLVLFAAVFALVSKLVTLVVVGGVERTNQVLAKISQGDLKQRVEERETSEFIALSEGINATVAALADLIDEAERRLEYDLATAKAIQESALPRTFPAYPEIPEFDIFASMDAAKEVGGDFFDFFLIDEHTLGFLIADVSGKGIPGALFMMAAKAELENRMLEGADLASAVSGANAYLSANNDAGMFVTAWAATLEWETGRVTYVNAGHNLPLLFRASSGAWEWLEGRAYLIMGVFDTVRYRSNTLTLEPGDKLVLYTDGVNEAFSLDEKLYGNDRLEAFLVAHADLGPKGLVEGLRADVAAWASGAEQSDDVTILALEYTPEANA